MRAASWDDPWAVGPRRSAEPWAVAGEWWDETRQAAADVARRERVAAADVRERSEAGGRKLSGDPRAGWRRLYLLDVDRPPAAESADHRPATAESADHRPATAESAGDRPAIAESAGDREAGYDAVAPEVPVEDTPWYDGPAVALGGEHPRQVAAGGRRTVTITGRGDDRQWSPTAPVQRPHRRRVDRIGYRPERVAMWAVLLGLVLVLVAATSSHAAVLEAHHALAHAPLR